MSIRVELTYDMSKALGTRSVEVESANTVADAIAEVRVRFNDAGEPFAKLIQVAAIAVNGVLVNHKRGFRTKLSDGRSCRVREGIGGRLIGSGRCCKRRWAAAIW